MLLLLDRCKSFASLLGDGPIGRRTNQVPVARKPGQPLAMTTSAIVALAHGEAQKLRPSTAERGME
jgi:hypothetical protein